LNSKKPVNGHINGKILQIVSRLIGPQGGLSISILSVEQTTLKVTHVITHSLLSVQS